jgi:energy-coupling factor transporter ATP-binding protein EcfA2
MTQIVTLVGDLGAGKTTLAKVLGMIAKAMMPDALVISNVEMGSGIQKIEDVHKFIAQKLTYHDKTYAFVIDDEAAQAGLESRGSGSKGAAVESRIITHARKAHVDLILISQLKSMIDKRAQWVEDVSILCEARFEDGNMTSSPDYFHYTVYDKSLEVLNEFELDFVDMKKWVWPGMETDDIPFFSAFKTQMESYYNIGPMDKREFDKIVPPKKSDWTPTFLNAMAVGLEAEATKEKPKTVEGKHMKCKFCGEPIVYNTKTHKAFDEETGEPHKHPKSSDEEV